MEEKMPYNTKRIYKQSNNKLNQSVDYMYYDENYNYSYEYERFDNDTDKYIRETQNNFITTTKLNNLGQVAKKHTFSKDLVTRTEETYTYDSLNRLTDYLKTSKYKTEEMTDYDLLKYLKKNGYL